MARLASVVALVSLAACAQPQPHAAPAAAKTATPQRVDETAGIDAAIAEATTTTSTSTTVAARPSRKRAVPARPNLQQEQGGNGATRSVNSTAYCLTGYMASGARVFSGAVAMNNVEFGAKWRVLDGPMAGRTFTVADRIGHGSQFDIAMPGDCGAARGYGRRTITIERVS